jgi:hypothetical protein
VAEAEVPRLVEPTALEPSVADALAAIRSGPADPDALVGAGRRHERLDQLVTELLLGVR